jgi:hypothetical protein
VAVVPGHPVLRTTGQFFAVLLQLGQVLEGVGPTKLARVNQTHEQVADVGTVLGLVEERIFSTMEIFP